jgi:hypothetical protein
VQSATVLVCEALMREFANGLQAASRPVHTWMAASQALLAMTTPIIERPCHAANRLISRELTHY